MRDQSLFHKADQVSGWHVQGLGKAEDGCQCGAFLGTFKGADVAALGVRKFGQLVLGKGLLQAQFLQHLTKDNCRQLLIPHMPARVTDLAINVCIWLYALSSGEIHGR